MTPNAFLYQRMAVRRLTAPWPTWAAPIVIGLTVIVAHLPSFLHRLLDGDEAVYGSIAVLMNRGLPLYGAGGVDNKPPGIFWVYSLAFRVFGAYQMTAVHAVGLVVIGATCVVIYLIAKGIAGPRAGLLAALFYGLVTAVGNPRILAANTEIFMMLPLCASVLLMLRRQWFWSGVLIVAATAFRQTAGVNVLLAALAIAWLEPVTGRKQAAMLTAGGLAAGFAAQLVLLAATGSLEGFFRWTVQPLVGYASGSWNLQTVWGRARDSLVPFVVDLGVLWIAAVALAAHWRSLSTQARLMVAWLMVAMLGSIAPGHLSWHYFIQAMGPLAVLAGLAFDRFQLRRAVTAAAVVGIAIPFVAWWIFNVSADPLTYDNNPPVPQHDAVAAYLAAHTSSSDRIFVWGDWPALYVESDRVMAGRFPGFLRGFDRGSRAAPNAWDTAPDVWPELQADFAAHPPQLIVDTSTADWSDFAHYPMSGYPVLAGIVAGQYHVLATVDGVVIYGRNGGT
jgi:hypothetical protein